MTHLQDIVENPYAWPGGYPKFAIMEDGGCLCAKCCAANRKIIERGFYPWWRIAAIEINWEDSELICDNCDEKIESAYGE